MSPAIRNSRPALEAERSVPRRQPKSFIPPDVVDGKVSSRPAIVRQAKLRYAAKYLPPTKTRKASKNFQPAHQWKSLEITLPRAVVEVAGLEPEMMIQMEAYVGGWVRLYAAGDVITREDEMV